MTIMGKILVILNLVVAFLVGGFLIFDFATRTNWKQAADRSTEDMSALTAARYADQERVKGLKAELDQLKTAHVKLEKDYNDSKIKFDKELNAQKDLTTAQERIAEKAKAVATAALGESTRLRQETALHQKAVEDRDEAIRALDEKNKTLLGRAVAAENNVNTLLVRTRYMAEQLEQLSKKLVLAETRGSGGTTTVRKPSDKNPPTVDVRGRITNVLRERGLVEVSLGSDDGVNRDHTLEVYRLKPKPEYLGTIKIVDADHHKAVGMIMRPDGGIRRSEIKANDEVASRIVSR